jgi:hypothetical protein
MTQKCSVCHLHVTRGHEPWCDFWRIPPVTYVYWGSYRKSVKKKLRVEVEIELDNCEECKHKSGGIYWSGHFSDKQRRVTLCTHPDLPLFGVLDDKLDFPNWCPLENC